MNLVEQLLKPTLLRVYICAMHGLELQISESWISTVLRCPSLQIIASTCPHDLASHRVTQEICAARRYPL